jgi:hypothetical protein
MEAYANFISTGEKDVIDKWLDDLDTSYATGASKNI